MRGKSNMNQRQQKQQQTLAITRDNAWGRATVPNTKGQTRKTPEARSLAKLVDRVVVPTL